MKCDPRVEPFYQAQPDPAPNFRKGDVICFKLRVDFPRTIDTKNAVVTDFPPVGTEFVIGSAPETGNNPFTITDATTIDVQPSLASDKFVFTLGTGGFVPAGGVFEATFAVRVLGPGTGTQPEITGNLMKMRTENTAGVAQSYRDQAEYGLVPPPNLAIAKGVQQTLGPDPFPVDSTYTPPADDKPVREGGRATFQVDVTNRPRNLDGADYSVRGIEVWDVLPIETPAIDCASIVSGSYTFFKGNDDPQPVPVAYRSCGNAVVNVNGADVTRQVIKWTLPLPDEPNNTYSLAPGEKLSLRYTVNIPQPVSVSTKWNNTAYVRSFSAFTDVPNITAAYYPEQNIDPGVPVQDSPPLSDPSDIFIRPVTVDKDAETSVTETSGQNNNFKTQATIGETITYTYSATIPAGATVYGAELSDQLPTGIVLTSIDDWGRDGFANKPAGFTFDQNVVSNPTGRLVFPAEYSNSTAQPQTFSVKVTAKVGLNAATCAGASTAICTVPATPDPQNSLPKTNTARFLSYPDPDSEDPITAQKTYTVRIMQPNPTITKSASPASVTSTSQDITYRLTAKTPGDRSPLYEVTVIDCVPDEITVKTPIPDGGVKGTNDNCQTTDQISITWTFGKLVPGVDKVLTYTANIKPGSPADVRFRNTVGMSGTSMPGVVDGEREYRTGGNADVFITGATLDKTVTPSVATIGQTVDYTVETKLPDANMGTLVVTDTLPPYIDYADISAVQTECFTTDAAYLNPVPCSIPAGSVLLGPDPAAPSSTGQSIAWVFDALPDQDKHRIIRITYKSRVSNLGQNVAGQTRTNTAQARTGYAQVPTTIQDALTRGTLLDDDDATITLTEPNVAIAKTVNNSDAITALPDDTFSYTVTVTNPQRSGGWGSTALNVKVRDCVPTGIVVLNPNGGTLGPDNTCASNSAMTWPVFDLAVNASREFTYTARLAGNTRTAQTNVAQALEWYSWQPSNDDVRRYGPVSADAVVTPVLPDVRIVKQASDPLAYIDKPYAWTIEVTNPSNRTPGPTAYQVMVDDVLPPNWTYTADSTVIAVDGTQVSTANPTVDATNPLAVALRWNTGQNLPVDKKLTITFQATPGADVVQTPGVGINVHPHVNTANTTWRPGTQSDGWNPVTSPNVTAQTFIANGDLQIRKSHVTDYQPPLQAEPDEVIPGTTFSWRFEVKNNGPDPFVGPYVVTDTLPAGLIYQGYSGTNWSCQQNQLTITCTHPNVPGGLVGTDALEDLFIDVYVALDAPAEIANTATVSGQTYDRDPSNNTSTDTVFTRPQADLAIEKSSSGKYVVGEQVEYTLAVTNLGPSTSRKPITVTDTLPSGLSIAAFDAAPWNCSPTGATATFTCVLNQDLLPQIDEQGGQAPLIKVIADVVESPGSDAENCAVVTPTTEDPVAENNKDCVTDPVVSQVQLGISKKTTGPNPVVAGQSTQFTVTVTNAGPAEAKNVQMQDVLEAGLKATSATGKGWTCDVGTGTIVTCTRKTFAVKDSPSDIVITADVLASVPGGTTVKNTATVTTTSPQEVTPDPATSTVDVIAKSDLGIEKTHQGGPWTIGKEGVWQVRVTNNGPSDNPGPLTVTDQLPVGNEFVSATGDGWACTAAGRSLTCLRQAGLIVGQNSRFTIRVDVVRGAWPEVVNAAEVSSPLPDTNPDNNRATDRVTVERAKQTADKLPPDPSVLPAKTTKQGQKIRTKVRCTPVKSSAAGEVSYCKVTRSKNGTIRITIVGSKPVRVTVTQFARGSKEYTPWKRVKRYVLRP